MVCQLLWLFCVLLPLVDLPFLVGFPGLLLDLSPPVVSCSNASSFPLLDSMLLAALVLLYLLHLAALVFPELFALLVLDLPVLFVFVRPALFVFLLDVLLLFFVGLLFVLVGIYLYVL